MNYSIAIKLGSSNTSIFKQGEGIVLFEPSLVAFSGNGKEREVKAVGTKAKKMMGRTDERTYVVSPISEGKISDPKLAKIMLQTFLTKVLGRGLVKPKVKAVVCATLGFSLEDRKLLEETCYNAGIQDVIVVPSVMCGALGYNFPIGEPKGACLVNIGGGSTDIAVVSMNTIIAGINLSVGGIAIDKAIEKCLTDEFGIKLGLGTAEKIKEEIGSLYKNDTSSVTISAIDSESKMPKDVEVTSNIIYSTIEKYFNAIVEGIKTVLNNCPPNIVEDVCENGIFLMGGTALLTGVEQYFRRALGVNIKMQDFTTAVDVLGAGKLLQDQQLLKDISEL